MESRYVLADRVWKAGMLLLLIGAVFAWARPASAVVLWSDLGATLVHETGPGTDILAGAVKRDRSSSDTLYFKFHVDPLSDASTEEYFAAFQLFQGNDERLAVGNSLKAWGYSAFNTLSTGEFNKVFGDIDLRSAHPESSSPGVGLPYELPRRGVEATIVFKVQYVPGADDLVTVWLNPDLAAGATEESQAESLVTRFKADATFDQLRLRHGGGGAGWTFSDIAIATSFSDFVSAPGVEAGTGSPGRGGASFTFRSWQREQGLPQNSVHTLVQTRDGYLWLGTDDGVARFDGVRFVSFGLREGLRSSRVRVLFEDSGGVLWVGTVAGGVTRCRRSRLETALTLADGLPSDSVTACAEDAKGTIWIGTEAGLAFYAGGRLSAPPAELGFKGKAITALSRDARGVMWIGVTGEGVFTCRDGKLSRLASPGVEDLLRDPHAILRDSAGRLWVGGGDDFVLCQDGADWRRYRIPRHLARPFISSLVEGPDGTIWAGSVSEGLFQFRSGKLAVINAGSGLSDNSVEALLADREGNLWAGTAGGLTRLRRRDLMVYSQNDGLGYGAVQGLTETAPGTVWAGKPGDGLYRWEGRTFSRIAAGDFFRRYPAVNALLMTADGSCWVGGSGGLVQFKKPNDAAPEPEPPVLAGRNVISLARSGREGLWAGTREGELWRRRQREWTRQTNFVVAHPICALTEATNGALWIGTEGSGLYRFTDAACEHFDKSKGLLSDLVRTLYLDRQGVLWIGTAGGGLSLWREGRIATLTTREGLPANSISQILEDDSGQLWLGSNRGVARATRRELEAAAEGRIPALFPRYYGYAEGMLSDECTGGYQPAGLKTRSGQLWFPTLKGVVVIDPRPHPSGRPPPAVLLEEVLLDGSVVTTDVEEESPPTALEGRSAAAGAEIRPGNLRVPSGKHRLEFHFTGLNFGAPDRVRFRYRIENLDADWVEAGARRSAYYGYIPAGQYRFQVTACNEDGVWSPGGAQISFTVVPSLWQTWWMLSLIGICLLVGVGGCVRLVEKRRLGRRLKLLEQERALERERARIAQDLHDDLGSSLTRITLLSDLLKAEKQHPAFVESHAQKISQSAAQTVQALEEIVWALRPGSDTLQSLVDYITHFANELFEGDSARCRLDIPQDLPAWSFPPEVRHNIFLVVKEALTNALKHAGAKEVRIQARAAGEVLEIVVEDDGRGFREAEAAGGPARHNGLGNMRKRAEAVGGTLKLESEPGRGTKVRLAVKALASTAGRRE